MRKPFDKDILHMLGGRAKHDAEAGLTMSHVETEYLAELVRARTDIMQDCINAITAEGAWVREGANDSWRGGMFYAAETIRKLKSET